MKKTKRTPSDPVVQNACVLNNVIEFTEIDLNLKVPGEHMPEVSLKIKSIRIEVNQTPELAVKYTEAVLQMFQKSGLI